MRWPASGVITHRLSTNIHAQASQAAHSDLAFPSPEILYVLNIVQVGNTGTVVTADR